MRIKRFNESLSDFDFYKSTYLEDEKSIVAAYYISEMNDNSITIINLQENEMEDRISMLGHRIYWLNPATIKIPLSQIQILSDVVGKKNYKFIKMPYWLYKRNKGFEIKRLKGDKIMSFIKSQINKEFLNKLNDVNVKDCFKITSSSRSELESYIRIKDSIFTNLNPTSSKINNTDLPF
jgi:hypothetical protein